MEVSLGSRKLGIFAMHAMRISVSMFSISSSSSSRIFFRSDRVGALSLASNLGSGGVQEPARERDSSSSASSSSSSSSSAFSSAASSASLDSSAFADNGSYGFGRPEMYKMPLVGSVDHYERHVFLCYKDANSWPAKVEAADYDPLPHSLDTALKRRRSEMPFKTRLTVMEENLHNDPEASNGDVLIFPDMVKYKGLIKSDVDSFVEEVLVAGKESLLRSAEPLVGSHVFICSHGSRDKRCGVCGPPLKERFSQEITKLGLDNKVFVHLCSHIGGHKYAGNVIIFSSNSENESVTGDWYGYVSPDDVPELLEQHIGQGKVIERLWRGQMGVEKTAQKELQQQRMGPASEGCDNCFCAGGQVQAPRNETGQQNGASYGNQ